MPVCTLCRWQGEKWMMSWMSEHGHLAVTALGDEEPFGYISSLGYNITCVQPSVTLSDMVERGR